VAGTNQTKTAVQALIQAWRKGGPDALRAADDLIEMGEREGLEAVAGEVGARVRVPHQCAAAMDACFALDARLAFTHIDPKHRSPDELGLCLSKVARTPDMARADERWVHLAVDLLELGVPRLTWALMEIVQHGAGPQLKADLLDRNGPAVGNERPADEAMLAKARVDARKLRDRLPAHLRKDGKGPEDPRLTELSALIDGLPEYVRAFYELIDGIDIGAEHPRDRFVIYGLDTALREARAWSEKHAPHETARLLVPRFLFPVAPDAYTKAGHSGGPDIAFEAPCVAANPILKHTKGTPKFFNFVKRATKHIR